MPCSPARHAANLANSKRSTGPRTAAGKARSRRNGLKHGLTGAGVVVPDEDVQAIQSRFDRLEAELDPASEMGRILVQRVALLSVRLERSARQEAAHIGERMRAAALDFDEDRAASVDRLMDRFWSEPAAVARRMSRTPEGLDRMVAMYGDVLHDLYHPEGNRWSDAHLARVENLMGRYVHDYRVSRVRALSEAVEGRFALLDLADGAGLDPEARMQWALDELGRVLRIEVARLRDLRESLDLAPVALDRSEAATRALFDASPEAILARKYESATERAMYRAIREFRELDESSMDLAPVADDLGPGPGTGPESPEPEAEKGRGTLASCFRGWPGRTSPPETRDGREWAEGPEAAPQGVAAPPIEAGEVAGPGPGG